MAVPCGCKRNKRKPLLPYCLHESRTTSILLLGRGKQAFIFSHDGRKSTVFRIGNSPNSVSCVLGIREMDPNFWTGG